MHARAGFPEHFPRDTPLTPEPRAQDGPNQTQEAARLPGAGEGSEQAGSTAPGGAGGGQLGPPCAHGPRAASPGAQRGRLSKPSLPTAKGLRAPTPPGESTAHMAEGSGTWGQVGAPATWPPAPDRSPAWSPSQRASRGWRQGWGTRPLCGQQTAPSPRLATPALAPSPPSSSEPLLRFPTHPTPQPGAEQQVLVARGLL